MSKPAVAIIDYGVGNLRSVEKAFLAVGHNAVVTQSPEEVVKAERIVLPGVGAFGAAMESLRAIGMDEAVRTVVAAGKPFMGICLGLQLLFTESFELGHYKGLNLIPGKVVQFFQPEDRTPETDALKVPHMGWNELIVRKPAPPLKDFPTGGMTYHVHSFYVCPEDKDVVAATARHGIEFCTAVWKDNVFACQFHPEKSGSLGLRILKNFGDWKP
ncbi:MAG: imidazole glycerol phosphate synthase subunit HisH [Armatimonadetes bacterium]|nr:imidazole glycerol phosphate synthase subunit HisH [Armatimonadota bacterium]